MLAVLGQSSWCTRDQHLVVSEAQAHIVRQGRECILFEGSSGPHTPRSWMLFGPHLRLLHMYLHGEPLRKAPPCSRCTVIPTLLRLALAAGHCCPSVSHSSGPCSLLLCLSPKDRHPAPSCTEAQALSMSLSSTSTALPRGLGQARAECWSKCEVLGWLLLYRARLEHVHGSLLGAARQCCMAVAWSGLSPWQGRPLGGCVCVCACVLPGHPECFLSWKTGSIVLLGHL